MSEAIITALIAAASAVIVAGCSIICQILINKGNQKKRSAEELEKEKQRAIDEAVKDAKLEARLSSIEHKLDVHNGYAEKLTKISTDIAVIKNDIKTLYKQGDKDNG